MDVDPKKLRGWGRLMAALLQTPDDELDDFLRERLQGGDLDEALLERMRELLVHVGRALDDPRRERWKGIDNAVTTLEHWEDGLKRGAAAAKPSPPATGPHGSGAATGPAPAAPIAVAPPTHAPRSGGAGSGLSSPWAKDGHVPSSPVVAPPVAPVVSPPLASPAGLPPSGPLAPPPVSAPIAPAASPLAATPAPAPVAPVTAAPTPVHAAHVGPEAVGGAGAAAAKPKKGGLRGLNPLMNDTAKGADKPHGENPLPFRSGGTAKKPPPKSRLAPSPELGMTATDEPGKRGPTTPFKAFPDLRESAPAVNEPPPGWTLARYAELCVERSLWPDNVDGRRARFAMTQAVEDQADAYFKRRFEKDPAQRKRWLELCSAHSAKLGQG